MLHKLQLNLAIGTLGTFGSLELSDVSTLAACAAGFGTAVWMVTQTTLAILKHLREKQEAKKSGTGESGK